MSNSTSLKGGAILFFTTLTRVRLPITSSSFLRAPIRRMSTRTEEEDLGAVRSDVEANGGLELERVAARVGLGRAEHDADLHPDLVDEDDHGPRLRDR